MVTVEPPNAAAGEPSPDLLEACRRGDREAFARLFEEQKDSVYSVAVHFCGDSAEAGDITQEVFLKLLTRIGQFRGQARFRTWLYRVVMNTFLDRSKARRREQSLGEAYRRSRDEPQRPEETFSRAERARQVARSLALLDAAFRAPLVLRYVAGLSYGEIGEALRLPPGTVASRISRGLRSLARELSHLEGG